MYHAFNGLLVLESVGTEFYRFVIIMNLPPQRPDEFSFTSRRLRDEPLETATVLVEQFGQRAATSLGEAQAAAYLDGRLRRAGLKVSADGFEAPVGNGWDGVALALLMLVAVLLYRWSPVGALLLALGALGVAVYCLRREGQPLLVERASSQNVIGTRALAQKPQKRVILLAPLDAPPQMPSLLRLLHDGDRHLLGRVGACGVIALLAVTGMTVGSYELRLACWVGQALPLIYLLFAAGADMWLRRAPASPGAVSHAGALAVLLDCAEELTVAEHTELWVVALGASNTNSGLRDLLRRYPFEPARTRFIALEGIGAGQLTYLSRVGLFPQQASDPKLLAHAAATDTADALINAEPHAYRHSPTTLALLRQRGWQAVGLTCTGPDGQPPHRASATDTPDALEAEVLDRAVRLAVAIVRRVDAE